MLAAPTFIVAPGASGRVPDLRPHRGEALHEYRESSAFSRGIVNGSHISRHAFITSFRGKTKSPCPLRVVMCAKGKAMEIACAVEPVRL
jgi:hypothetical protein